MSGTPVDTVQARLASAVADRYRIERELGSGGMATVYLAHDIRHDRDVAMKVLHPELGAALGGERFLSEIKTTARLQHPHILPLLDSGEADGLLFYVMPFIQGETLRTRLERERQLPIHDAVRIAREVADALHAAHAIGIIHRDIKPENVLLQGGHALVADFGIALAVHHAGGHRMTQTGLSLGTPQYMSPEQAMGEKTVDARSDVYSLGAITFEMLSGEPPFTGGTVQAIVAKLMADPARPLRQLRKSVPEHVEAAVQSALEKLPADRLPTAAAFAEAIGDQSFTAPSPAVKGRTRRRAAKFMLRPWWIASIALNALLLVAAVVLWQRKPPQPTSRQQVTLWQRNILDPLGPGAPIVATQAAIAPDGSSIVFTDSVAGGFQLFRKDRDAAAAIPIAGTEGGVSPFFSPDGQWIGYITIDGRVRKVPVGGGGSMTLSEEAAAEYKSGTWLDDGTIVYADMRGGLSRVPADGGASVRIPVPERAGQPVTLSALPGSRGFIVSACSGNCSASTNAYVFDFKADSVRLLVSGAAGAWYSATGHLLYTNRDGGLYASGFDARSLELRPGAVPVLEGVQPTRFTVSASGTILYSAESTRAPSELKWVTRDGRAEPVDSTWQGFFEYPAISPDGSAIAVSLREKTTDLWVRRTDGTRQKIIAGGVSNWRSSWMPDGKSIAFTSIRNPQDPHDVAAYVARTDQSARAELLFDAQFGIWEVEVSRDGEWLVVRMDELNLDSNVRARRLRGDTTLLPLLMDSTADAISVSLSPDTRWLAYASNETGQRYEVYVASFPDMAVKVQASNGGGVEPRWSRDGRELFFVSGGQLMSVQVPAGPAFNPGNPRPLFPVAGYRRARNRQQYDVGPDGRFVMIREGAAERANAVYVENWFTELLAKVTPRK